VTPRSSASFSIKGFLRAAPVTASWRDGYLMADEELSEQIDQLIAGECTFLGLDGLSMKAGLSDPSAALLTVVRSFSRVTHANIKFALDDRWGRIVDGEGTVMAIRGHGEPPGAQGDLQDSPCKDAPESNASPPP
jgi:hypothetical protein